jgi:hypothetical protein
MTPTQFSTAPVPVELIAAAFDRLARIPAGSPLQRGLLITMAQSICCHDREVSALLVRIRAAAIVFADPRWSPWAQVFKSCDADARRAFDAGLLSVIAELQLDSALRFEPDLFFRVLLADAEPGGQC